MSPSRPLLIFLLLFLNPALGFPVAKRLSNSEVGEDVLAGSDFLSVFMKTSPARNVAPSLKYGTLFGVKTRNTDYSETNSVIQKAKEDIHIYSDINHKEDVLETDTHVPIDQRTETDKINTEEEKSNYQDRSYAQATMTATEKIFVDSTTASPTTTTITDDAASTYYDLDEEQPTIVQGFRDDRSTKPTVTQFWAEPQSYLPPPTPVLTNTSDDQPLQVISVRVSSSVVRHSHHKIDDPLKGFESEKINKPAVSTLITQEQPTNTAIQRSHLNVEEATMPEGHLHYNPVKPLVKINPPSSGGNLDRYQFSSINKPVSNGNNIPKIFNTETTESIDFRSDAHQRDPEEEEVRKIEQTDFLKIQQNQNQTLPQPERLHAEERLKEYSDETTRLPNDKNFPQALPYQYNPVPQDQRLTGVDYRNNNNYYKTTTSIEESKPEFPEEKRETPVITNEPQPEALAYQYNPQLSPVSYHTSVSSATSGSRVQFYRGPPSYRRGAVAETVQRTILAEPKQEYPYSLPPKPVQHNEPREKSYELPEQNYEVDEAISVVTNGRAHGVQIPTPTPTQESSQDEQNQKGSGDDDNNKSGYVVEGRNFRKYRVEERTADGFIVGEYGVVSHDDGSLRGVRYTADSTINPRLIYDALVKFLSLK